MGENELDLELVHGADGAGLQVERADARGHVAGRGEVGRVRINHRYERLRLCRRDQGDATAMDEKPPRRRAALTRGAHRSERDRAYGQIQIGALLDDDGVVTAELEDGFAQATTDYGRYLLAGPH